MEKKVPVEKYDRVTGYYRNVDNFNPGKKEEVRQRKRYHINELEVTNEVQRV